jgi:hypothetical protein
MISLPIPVEDETRYSDLRIDDETYYDLMKRLRPKIRCDGILRELTEETRCHVDPDIYESILTRYKNWKPCFGQIGAAQSHLANQNVQKGDLFLFFGWFRRTMLSKKRELKFYGSRRGFHSIFGYMQIGDVVKCSGTYREPMWMRGHPHLLRKRRMEQNNTIYIASDRLTWGSGISGAGVFQFDRSLVLTKEGSPPSRWSLPDLFRSVNISYHSEESWKDGYFQSATIGQEFVIEPSKEVGDWAIGLTDKCGRMHEGIR